MATFKFGGYMKADFMNMWYMYGDLGGTSPCGISIFPVRFRRGTQMSTLTSTTM